ncbi:MAG: HK97 gp10 family phage protein [Clostridia bacterium]|nr:HK97 gp10 family phage protein [Clostridia bacterium]
MADVIFVDNHVEVLRQIEGAVGAFLTESSSEIVDATARGSRVNTGQLKGSWKANVYESQREAVIGSELENAIWEEFGTGEYAINGNGRKTPWRYCDVNGKWHTTTGKRPTRAFEKGRAKAEPKIIQRAKDVFGSL